MSPSEQLPLPALEHCDITALFGIFSEINEHQNLMRLRLPVSGGLRKIFNIIKASLYKAQQI